VALNAGGSVDRIRCDVVARGRRLDGNCPRSECVDRPDVERQRAAVGGEIDLVAIVAEQLDPTRAWNRVCRAGVGEGGAGRSDNLYDTVPVWQVTMGAAGAW
jgi:hypothetical protein